MSLSPAVVIEPQAFFEIDLEGLVVPVGQERHERGVECAAKSALSSRYFPGEQDEHVEAPPFEYSPAEHLAHKLRELCRSAEVPASLRNVPAGQIVHTDAAPVLYIPALQVKQVCPSLL